jgi:hypothetical protein
MESSLTWEDVFANTQGAIFPIFIKARQPGVRFYTKKRTVQETSLGDVFLLLALKDIYFVVFTKEGLLARFYFASYSNLFRFFDPIA